MYFTWRLIKSCQFSSYLVLHTSFISDAPKGIGEIEPNVAETAVYTQRLPVYFHCFLVLVLTH